MLKNWAFIHILLDSQSRKQKQALVKTASEEQFKTLAEIVANTLARLLLVSPSGRKQLLLLLLLFTGSLFSNADLQ